MPDAEDIKTLGLDLSCYGGKGGQILKMDDELLKFFIPPEECMDGGPVGKEGDTICNFESSNLLPLSAPYKEHEALMTVIPNVDGLIKKQVVKAGAGSLIEPNMVVLVHYQIHQEGLSKPCDSTIVRKRPASMTVEVDCMPCMAVALTTMRQRETSRFLIDYRIAYGEYGCPPRILPKQDILLDIEVLKILKDVPKDADGINMPTSSDPLEITVQKAIDMLQQGKEMYVTHQFHDAKRSMSSAIELLNRTRVRNQEEQTLLENTLNRIKSNLIGVYAHTGEFEQVCILCREILHDNPKHERALMFYARAKIMFGQYDHAMRLINDGFREFGKGHAGFEKELRRLQKKKEDKIKSDKRINQLKEDLEKCAMVPTNTL